MACYILKNKTNVEKLYTFPFCFNYYFLEFQNDGIVTRYFFPIRYHRSQFDISFQILLVKLPTY